MRYIKGIEAYQNNKQSAVTLGKFDGFHRGHMKLVHTVKQLASEQDIDSVVCSFDMRPLLKRKNPHEKLLMTMDERVEKLADQIDYFVDCPFTEAICQMEAEDFIKKVLVDTFHAAYVVVGVDFGFGYGKRGNVQMLAAYAAQYGYELIVHEKERHNGTIISSSYTKEALALGNMKLVRELLGYPYTITGKVVHGDHTGRSLGVPTINVIPDEWKLMPPNGVYFNRVKLEGVWHNAVGNIGVKPTVTEDGQVMVESFLLDYHGDAYEKEVRIELYEFHRQEKQFSDVNAMQKEMLRDIEAGKKYFENGVYKA